MNSSECFFWEKVMNLGKFCIFVLAVNVCNKDDSCCLQGLRLCVTDDEWLLCVSHLWSLSSIVSVDCLAILSWFTAHELHYAICCLLSDCHWMRPYQLQYQHGPNLYISTDILLWLSTTVFFGIKYTAPHLVNSGCDKRTDARHFAIGPIHWRVYAALACLLSRSLTV